MCVSVCAYQRLKGRMKKSLPIVSFQPELVKHLRVLVIRTRWNERIVTSLTDAVVDTLNKNGVSQVDIKVVPGCYELPFAAKRFSQFGYNAIVVVGVLIKGETMHFEYLSQAVSTGIMQVGLDTGIPVVFGVLTCLNEQQALDRAGLGGGAVMSEGGEENLGRSWATAAIEMSLLY